MLSGKLLFLAGLWIIWCGLHSLLITHRFTFWLQRVMKERFALYRLIYTFFSIISLVPVLAYQISLDEKVLIDLGQPWAIFRIILLLFALVMFGGAARLYDLQTFLGWRQVKQYMNKKVTSATPFHTDGILKYVRHPLYAGAIAFIWGVGPITDVSLVAKVILTGYLIIGTVLEEQKLIVEIGEPYQQYRRQVPMLIPWKLGRK